MSEPLIRLIFLSSPFVRLKFRALSLISTIYVHPWPLSGPGGVGSDRIVGGGPAEQARAGVHCVTL